MVLPPWRSVTARQTSMESIDHTWRARAWPRLAYRHYLLSPHWANRTDH